CFRKKVKLPDFLVAKKHASHIPRDALAHHALADAKAVPDIQRALSKTDGARTNGQRVIIVQYEDFVAVARQVQCHAHSHWARADYQHGPVAGRISWHRLILQLQ